MVESDDIGANTRVWAFAHVMAGASIGKDCNIGDHAFVEAGVRLGNNVTVKNGVAVWGGVEVEDDVFLGPNCVFTNDPNPRAYIKKTGDSLVSTRVRTRATIGANATIVCGITIGQYAFIGAGTVVIRDVPDFAMVVGKVWDIANDHGAHAYSPIVMRHTMVAFAPIVARCRISAMHRFS